MIFKSTVCAMNQVKFVNPLLVSSIVGDEAYEALVKLSSCTASPLCNWAFDIAACLRLITTEGTTLFEDITSVGGNDASEKPLYGLFERVVNGLSLSCKTGGLPVDSFIFVFPVSFYCFTHMKGSFFVFVILSSFYLHNR